METDNLRTISEFIDWAKFRGVYDLLPDYDKNNKI